MTKELDRELEEHYEQLAQEGAAAYIPIDNEVLPSIVLTDGMTEEERAKELTGYLVKAIKEHVETKESPVSGLAAIEIDTDIPLYTAVKPTYLQPGMYLLNPSEELSEVCLYSLRPNRKDLQKIVEGIEAGDIEAEEKEQGAYAVKSDIKIGAEVVRLEIEEGRPLHYLEAMTFLAMKDAETEEELTRIFSLGFISKAEQEIKQLDELNEVEAITLADFKLAEKFSNHTLAMKALQGLVEIAHGKPEHELTPKGGKSQERYKLTASEDACSRFFAIDGGNAEQLARILETVYTLRTDKRAEGFISGGRIWFTLNSIVEELLRTSSGTIRGRDNEKAKRLVDDALLAASGGQIVGTSPDGNPLNIDYLINAVRREKVTYNGALYEDVWGFAFSEKTINDYATQLGQAYRYPLLEMPGALSTQQAGVERYLKDLLHEARGRLYTRTGNTKKQRNTTIKRAWAEIESTFKPLGEMSVKQRKKLVEDFNKILSVLADMESHDALHEGRPLYINAYSLKAGGRGGYSGKREYLVLECSTNFKRPNVDLL